MDMDAIAAFRNTPDSLRLYEGEKEKAKIRYTGFLAQEVEQAALSLGFDFSGIDKPAHENDNYGLRYAEFVVPLVKAVQQLSEENEVLRAALEEQGEMFEKRQKEQNKLMEERLEALEKK